MQTYIVITENFDNDGLSNDNAFKNLQKKADELIRKGYEPIGSIVPISGRSGGTPILRSISQAFWLDIKKYPEYLL